MHAKLTDISRAPVAVDLFGGAGGLTEGLLASGVRVAVSVEKHPHAALTHAFNHPGVRVLCGDVRELDAESIRGHVEEVTGDAHVDLIVGGPPCQGFSSAGKRDVNDPRNELVNEFVRIVSTVKPRMFIFENVMGFANMCDGKIVHGILDSLWEAGYSFHGIDNESEYYPRDFPVFDSSHFGAPQRRKRFVLVGWRETLPNAFKSPRCCCRVSGKAPTSKKRRGYVTIADAISDLSFLSAGHEAHVYVTPAMSGYQKARRKNSQGLFNHLATKHRGDTVAMFRRIGPGRTISSIPEVHRTGKQRMRRFDQHDTSGAILALPDDYIHYSRHRIPTVREMARLQTFDDDYVFFGKRTTSDLSRRIDVPQYTQVGNAVPPLLAYAIGKAVVRSLGAVSCDLRRLKERKERHSWIRGSSSFHGYTLDSRAQGQIDLLDIRRVPIQLPISSDKTNVRRRVSKAK